MTYADGSPRVLASMPPAVLEAAIDEYEAFAAAHPDDPQAEQLLRIAAHCREELDLRAVSV